MSTPSTPTTGTTGTPTTQPVTPGTPTPQTSGTPAQTQGGSSPTTGNTLAKPFVPAKFDVPLLEDDGKNYDTWYVALQLVFKNQDIWPIVNGTKLHPDQMTDSAGYSEWGFKDRKARLMMITVLKKVGQKCIYHATSAKEYWDWITTCYSGTGGGNERTITLLQQFFKASFMDTEPLQPQINKVVYVAQQLETLSFPIIDHLLAFLLAIRLPDSYAMLRTIITNSDASNITSRWVADCIIGEESHRLNNFEGNKSAFYAKAGKGKGKMLQITQGKGEDLKCAHCKKKGHKKADCHKLKKEKAEKEAAKNTTDSGNANSTSLTSPSNAMAKIAVASEPDNDSTIIRLFHAVAVPRRSHSAERPSTTCERILQAKIDSGPQSLEAGWIIDSGALRNMCAHHDWFHHYSPLSSPMDVVLSDNSAIQATGVSCISVRMHAEGKSLPAVLQDVLHVLELHGNLLLVSHFAKRSSEMHFVGEGCSILDQCKIVACKGDLCGNLYVMWITTLPISELAHIVVLDSFPAEGKDRPEAALIADNLGSKASINIWHQCLGHLNADDVICMARKGLACGMVIISNTSPSSHICEPCIKGKQTCAKI